ncbi:MAG: B12-binding domain-containing protein [Burkholderiales bacterium]|jgi:methylmalonyl-CoA mutase cobalamin-binding domain/chain|nr:cobalamin B12-binding domain-containing protein [Betaproteobacteria bacterium]
MSDGSMMGAGVQADTRSRASSRRMGKPSAPAATSVQLVSVIESQIIPQLLAADRPAAPGKARFGSNGIRSSFTDINRDDIAEFTHLLLQNNMSAIGSLIDLWRAKGTSVETIYLELLTGAARYLGELWGDDDCNFCEVGLAVWRIQQVMYDLRPAFFAEGAAVTPSGYRLLLAPMALEQHTLGLMMTAEFFRRDGWDVSSELPIDNAALSEAVSREHIDLLGLSVSSEAALQHLPEVLAAVRKASRNPNLVVMVGGWMFVNDPNKPTTVGADFCVGSVTDALIRGERFVTKACYGDRVTL